MNVALCNLPYSLLQKRYHIRGRQQEQDAAAKLSSAAYKLLGKGCSHKVAAMLSRLMHILPGKLLCQRHDFQESRPHLCYKLRLCSCSVLGQMHLARPGITPLAACLQGNGAQLQTQQTCDHRADEEDGVAAEADVGGSRGPHEAGRVVTLEQCLTWGGEQRKRCRITLAVSGLFTLLRCRRIL